MEEQFGKIVKIAIAVVVVIVLLLAGGSVYEIVDADQIMVVQSPISGKLSWYKTAGIKPQWFGKVTKYPKRSQFWFSAKDDQGKKKNESIKIRFNDGGHASISGSVAWEMPQSEKQLTKLHMLYGSFDAVQLQLIRTIVEKCVYMTGPLMSSQQSYAEKRNELLQYIEDQLELGVYLTKTTQVQQPDPMTGKPKTVNVVEIVEKGGRVLRAGGSPLKELGIKTFNLSINSVDYSGDVENQITAQQKAIMDVQTAMAEAKKAEQAAITAEKNGQAEAAKAKWEQEVIKAKEVTAAEQRKEVATLDVQTAEQRKKEQTLLGEGEAARRKLVMAADGALDKKLATYEKVNQMWATAVSSYSGQWVPSVVMGGGGTAPGGGSSAFMDMLNAKIAQDLALSMKLPTSANK